MVRIAQRILGSECGEWAGMCTSEAMGGEAARRPHGHVLFTRVLLQTATKKSSHKRNVVEYLQTNHFCFPDAFGLS